MDAPKNQFTDTKSAKASSGGWPAGGRHSPHEPRGRRPLPLAEDGNQARPSRGTNPDRRTAGKPPSDKALERRERELIGGFSETSKMPWLSWSTPASRCQLGSRLRGVPGSVCRGCYAFRGNYRFASTQAALERRHAVLADLGKWTDDMVACLTARAAKFTPSPSDPWPAFRWHDSGDVQSAEHLEAICVIAERTQGVTLADGTHEDMRHWLPTREYGHVAEVLGRRTSFPRNLRVRLSAHMVDGPVPASLGLPVSSVHSRPGRYPDAHECPAYRQSPASCGPCRACWDAGVAHVSYPAH